MPRLSTAPRGARPEPHPRQHRGFLSHLGARLRRAGQSSRAPRTPFRSAATVLALLTTLTLSLGFVPSAGAQTTTCGAPDSGRTSRGLEWSSHGRSHRAERFGHRLRLPRRQSGTLVRYHFRTLIRARPLSQIIYTPTLHVLQIFIDVELDPTTRSGVHRPRRSAYPAGFADMFVTAIPLDVGNRGHWETFELSNAQASGVGDWSTLSAVTVACPKAGKQSRNRSTSRLAERPSSDRNDSRDLGDSNRCQRPRRHCLQLSISGSKWSGTEIELQGLLGDTYTITRRRHRQIDQVVTTFADDHGLSRNAVQRPGRACRRL